VKSLIKLSRKDVIFNWNEACKIAFELLKKTVIEASILAHFDLKKQIYTKKRFFRFRFSRSFVSNEKEWWTSFDDIFFEEFRIDRIQLRNLWQEIVDNRALFWAMKIWIIVHWIWCFDQNTDEL
jgi:hypothetical protein